MPDIAHILPKNVKPLGYDLWFKPDLENFKFEGHAVIRLDVLEYTDTITFHSADLVFNNVLLRSGLVPYVPNEIAFDKNKKTVTLKFSEKFGAALYTQLIIPKFELEISFTGEINDQLCGWYRSIYELPSGEKRYMATTQCEAIDARRVFPCWDEPAQKASFKVTVEIPENLTAISNMPAYGESTTALGWKQVNFYPTPPMSTYLFALMVGEFEWVEKRTKDNVLVRVCTTPGKKDLGKFALTQAVAVLEYYTEYFGVPYPLPKLDLVAIPDFAAGAMENWGADTFRETYLLIDPINSSIAAKERVVEVIDHEIAHQWHGDLVTMSWWDGLWLNEGFASWMELIAGSKLHPNWGPEEKFLAEDFLRALSADALASSHPIHSEIKSDDEINEGFDWIAYSKGAAVIRMIENFIGSEVFRRGLKRYMQAHAYGNTNPEDLWDALETESGKPVRYIMDPWIKQIGYPIIEVKRTTSDDGQSTLSIKQERFLYEETSFSRSEIWSIPIGISVKSGNRLSLLIDSKESKAIVPYLPGDWIKLNSGHTGFFRVYYEPSDLKMLSDAIKHWELPVSDRIVLCDDVFALTRAGYYPSYLFLDFLNSYENEDNLHVWQVIISRLNALALICAGAPFANSFSTYTRKLLRNIVKDLGWEEKPNEPHDKKILRELVLLTAGENGDETIINEARRRFADYVIYPEGSNPNLRRAVLGIAAASGNLLHHKTMREFYVESKLQEEQERILRALTSFSNPDLIMETLRFIISGKVRSQDIYVALRGASENPVGRDLTWQFVKDNWRFFTGIYEKGKLLGNVISAVCSTLSGFKDEQDVREFFKANPVPDAKRTIEQALENIRINVKWLNRDYRIIKKWFEDLDSHMSLSDYSDEGGEA